MDKARQLVTPDEEPTIGERLGRHGSLIGVVALVAWLALLWFMFSDVL